MSDELVEVVDHDGTVQRVVTRREMRAGNLRHRATYVVVVNERDELLAHQRAGWKDVWPLRWDLAFGGVCGVGEGWLDSARRELAEEAGVTLDAACFTERGALAYAGPDTTVVGRWYEVRYGGPVEFADGEVIASQWVPRHALRDWVRDHQLCDDTAEVIVPQYVDS